MLVIPWVLALLGDNPMQSELACHRGLMAKIFCRVCWVKGFDYDDLEEVWKARADKEAQKKKSSAEKANARFMAKQKANREGCNGDSSSINSETSADSSSSHTPAPKVRARRRKPLETFQEMVDRVKRFMNVRILMDCFLLLLLLN